MLKIQNVFGPFFKADSKVTNFPENVSKNINDNERIHADNNTRNEYFTFIFKCDSSSDSEHRDRSLAIKIDGITLIYKAV